MSHPAGLLPFLGFSVLIAAADQLLKRAVAANLHLGESRVLIPDFLSLTHFRNRGGAFSLLAGLPPVWGRAFFIAATLGVLVFVFYLYRSKSPETRFGHLSLILIFGGGLGNLVDRVLLGEVVDFILFYWGSFYWPAFNLADSCITVGVALLALEIIRNPYGDPPPAPGDSAAPAGPAGGLQENPPESQEE